MNFVGYDIDDEDKQDSPLPFVEPGATTETENNEVTNKTQRLETIRPEYLRLCETIRQSNGTYSFIGSFQATSLYKLPDLVDQIGLMSDFSSLATHFPNQVLPISWDGHHQGKPIVDAFDAEQTRE